MTKDFTIQAKNLHFDYNEKTQVFNDHNIHLVVSKSQKNKLYGIIGPSGTGKTTLISILGGQLKPTKGNIEIDKVNIYEVTDSIRRGLITMQMQTSTSLRGKLKYNMVFGLPENTFTPINSDDEQVEQDDNNTAVQYTDDYLIQVLKNVGLWSIFKDKDGLDTLIGEGGLNLSGGQRQRLNFAGLYLRAKHFEPSLILIDEPTSSLDEISEMAITKMILELAEIAVTFVVAHRLKTLEEAVAILDSSLIDTYKDLNFYSRSQLKTKSQYYQDLMAGKAKLDDE
ncbi:MAG: ATP-binding cassette domain-containing protein [bacterium]